MKPELVTFDCAQTLVQTNWQVGRFAVDCARHAGLDLADDAGDRYAGLFRERQVTYLELNLTRDAVQCDRFWSELTRDWLLDLGQDPTKWQALIETASNEIGFSANSTIFKVYDDVVPCLDELSRAGIRTAIISNWDYSLHRILKVLNLHSRFDLVVASLEEGFEKPDPRIFLQTLEKLGVEPSHAVHVGDDTIDDLQGARNVGMRALLINRDLKSPASPPYIASLNDLLGAIDWKS